MNDPERLLDKSSDDFERALLRSARIDGPSPQGKQRALAALGLSAALLSGSTASVAAPSAVSTVVSWMAVGALVGTGTFTAVSALSPEPPRPALSAVPVAQPPRVLPQTPPALPAAPPSASASPPRDLPSAAPLAAMGLPPPSVAKPLPPTPASAPPVATVAPPQVSQETSTEKDPLLLELRLLDEARGALTRGDLATAGHLVTQHRERFPRGKLGLEAEVLTIELLSRQGNRGEAQRRAEAFVQGHPTSPHAPRLRALFGF